MEFPPGKGDHRGQRSGTPPPDEAPDRQRNVTNRHQLAQVSIARLLAPLDSPHLADFVAALEPVNAAADAAEGYVWRLQTDDGEATALRVFDDDWLIVTMSVWRDLEAFSAYVFSDAYRQVLSRRREWFARAERGMTALWWVPARVRPTVAEAEQRLITLRRRGPTQAAFTLRETFPAPPYVPSGPGGRTEHRCRPTTY
jgi:heme-degrading monooxygenase HmoA